MNIIDCVDFLLRPLLSDTHFVLGGFTEIDDACRAGFPAFSKSAFMIFLCLVQQQLHRPCLTQHRAFSVSALKGAFISFRLWYPLPTRMPLFRCFNGNTLSDLFLRLRLAGKKLTSTEPGLMFPVFFFFSLFVFLLRTAGLLGDD
jgi:hypothetical protein